MEQAKRRILIGVAAALVCEVLFGLSYSFTKSAMGSADEIDLLGWRFLIAAASIIALRALGLVTTDLRRKLGESPLGRQRTLLLAVIAVLDPVLYFVGETFGISRTSASESGVFLACIPIIAIVLSSLILKKRPSRRQVVGILITMSGVLAAVLASGLDVSFSPLGYAFLALGVASYALYTVFVERAAAFTGVEITFAMLLAGAAFFGSAFLLKNLWAGTLAERLALPLTDPGFLIAILYQGIACSLIAFFASNTAIAHIGVNATSSFVGVSSVVAILAGVFALGEPLGPLQILGTALIVFGVALANSPSRATRAKRVRSVAHP